MVIQEYALSWRLKTNGRATKLVFNCFSVKILILMASYTNERMTLIALRDPLNLIEPEHLIKELLDYLFNPQNNKITLMINFFISSLFICA